MMEILMRPLLLLLLTVHVQSQKDTLLYNAGTCDYEPIYVKDDPVQTMRQNVQGFTKWIENVAANHARIIVFPELGLTSINLPSNLISSNWSIEVPDPKQKIVPCGNMTLNEVLRDISCVAKRRNVYVVINLIEKKDDKRYSSNVVFSSEGEIISRYRKYHRYNEFGNFDRPQELIATAFETSFGTFGILIGADILYEEPARTLLNKEVKDFVYPVAWKTMLPFSTSYQLLLEWSKANDVIVISAPYYSDFQPAGGIFHGKTLDPKNAKDKACTVYPVRGMKRSSINDINETIRDPIGGDCQIKNNNIERKYTNMKPFHKKKIVNGNNSWIENAGDITCKFEVTADLSKSTGELYYLFAYSGQDNVLGENCNSSHTSVCAIVKCYGESLENCGQVGTSKVNFTNIKVQATYNQSEHELIFPSTLQNSFDDVQYQQLNSTNRTTGEVQKMMQRDEAIHNLVVFGIFRKSFARCGLNSDQTANSSGQSEKNSSNASQGKCNPEAEVSPDNPGDSTSVIVWAICGGLGLVVVCVLIMYRRPILSKFTD